MTWQKIVRHISDERIVVESKSGNQYPVGTEYERDGEAIYSKLMNRANDDKTYWAWVNFDGDDGPVLQDYLPSEDYPGAPPWER